jgi:hypothetical protein
VPYGVAQGAAAAHGSPELQGQTPEHRLGFQIAACPANLIFENFGNRKVLEERNDVGEGFVQSQNIEIGRLVEAAMHAIENRVGGFVRDDIV